VGLFDKTYMREIFAILRVRAGFDLKEELTLEEYNQLRDRLYLTTKQKYKGNMRDFGALLLLELLRNENDAITHLSLVECAVSYHQDFSRRINKDLEIEFLAELASQAKMGSLR